MAGPVFADGLCHSDACRVGSFPAGLANMLRYTAARFLGFRPERGLPVDEECPVMRRHLKPNLQTAAADLPSGGNAFWLSMILQRANLRTIPYSPSCPILLFPTLIPFPCLTFGNSPEIGPIKFCISFNLAPSRIGRSSFFCCPQFARNWYLLQFAALATRGLLTGSILFRTSSTVQSKATTLSRLPTLILRRTTYNDYT